MSKKHNSTPQGNEILRLDNLKNLIVYDKRAVFLALLKNEGFLKNSVKPKQIVIDDKSRVINAGLEDEFIYSLHHIVNGFNGTVKIVNYKGFGNDKTFYIYFGSAGAYVTPSEEIERINKELKLSTGTKNPDLRQVFIDMLKKHNLIDKSENIDLSEIKIDSCFHALQTSDDVISYHAGKIDNGFAGMLCTLKKGKYYRFAKSKRFNYFEVVKD